MLPTKNETASLLLALQNKGRPSTIVKIDATEYFDMWRDKCLGKMLHTYHDENWIEDVFIVVMETTVVNNLFNYNTPEELVNRILDNLEHCRLLEHNGKTWLHSFLFDNFDYIVDIDIYIRKMVGETAFIKRWDIRQEKQLVDFAIGGNIQDIADEY